MSFSYNTISFCNNHSGNNPYYIYGIQLLPLTPISEYRDDVEWGKEMFGPFSKTCDQICTSGGWSVGVLAILATIGQKQMALEQAEQLASGVFETPGGGGHSKSNTLWYLSTRPEVEDPYSFSDNNNDQDPNFGKDITCFQPSTCTDAVMTTLAEGHSCRDRILWLMQTQGLSERGACTKVADIEYPNECGGCNPSNNVIVDNIDNNNSDGDVQDDTPNNSTNIENNNDSTNSNNDNGKDEEKEEYCYQPSTCTDAVLDTLAEGFSCRSRIKWLMGQMKMSYKDACFQIAVQEYTEKCGKCDPNGER